MVHTTSFADYWASGSYRPEFDPLYYFRYFEDHMGTEGWLIVGAGLVVYAVRLARWQTISRETTGYLIVGVAAAAYITAVSSKNWFVGPAFYLPLWLFAWCALAPALAVLMRRRPRLSMVVPGVALSYCALVIGMGALALTWWPEYGRSIGPSNRAATAKIAHDLRTVMGPGDRIMTTELWGYAGSLMLFMGEWWHYSYMTSNHLFVMSRRADPETVATERTQDCQECKFYLFLDAETVSKVPHISTVPVVRPYWDAMNRRVREPSSPYIMLRDYPIAPYPFTSLLAIESSPYAPSLKLYMRADGRTLTDLGFDDPHDGILFGQGWSDADSNGGARTRWGARKTEIILSPSDRTRLTLELEPGPGIDARTARVDVLANDGTVVQQVPLDGRTLVTLDVPGSLREKRVLRLTAQGDQISTTRDRPDARIRLWRYGWGDANTLEAATPRYDARVLRDIASATDIVPSASRRATAGGQLPPDGLFVGHGWYPFELFRGETFRWMNTGGEVVVTRPMSARGRLILDLEPGPGLGGRPAEIDVMDDDGHTLGTIRAQGHQTVDVELPTPVGAEFTVFRLTPTSTDQPVPGDPRMLNVRVFSMRWEPLAGAPVAAAPAATSAPPTTAPAGATRPSQAGATVAQAADPTPEPEGLYADGWAAQRASTQATRTDAQTVLVVRGLVPMIDDAGFTTELTVSVDGREVARQALKLGDFTVQAAVPDGADTRHVDLQFSRVQQLPGGDGRLVGARIVSLAFEPAQAAPPPATTAPPPQPTATPSAAAQRLLSLTRSQDITPAPHRQAVERGEIPTDGLFVGEGWYPFESFGGNTFHWVDNDATLILTRPSGSQATLSLEIEPGPGLGLQPFTLQVRDECGVDAWHGGGPWPRDRTRRRAAHRRDRPTDPAPRRWRRTDHPDRSSHLELPRLLGETAATMNEAATSGRLG